MNNLSRRRFLQTAGAAGVGAMIIPNFISCAPSTKLRFAVIGVGGRGRANWGKVPKENIVAVCDVDEQRAAEGFKHLSHAKKYTDFRKMFDEMGSEIDAVMVSTPDHTHFPAAMAAMELGKHIYIEKPLAHNIWQLRTLKKAAKYYNVVSQMGNQGHTTNGIRLVKEWYEAGVLGEVKEVIAWQGPIDWVNDGYFLRPETFPPQKEEVPAHLDWDLWVGPAKMRDFNHIYAPKTWRGFYDFGNGKLGDWSCHTLDAPFWALDMGMPTTVDAEIKNPQTTDNSWVAQESKVTWQFPSRGNKSPVKLTWQEGFEKPEVRPEWGLDEMPGGGMIMIGEKNTLYHGGRPNNPRLLMPEADWKEFLKNAPDRTIPRVEEENPVGEWVDAIKNGTLPGSNFDYSADLTEMALIGVMAQRFGGHIDYDAKNATITNRPELNAYVKEPMREGWVYGENL